MKAFHDKQETKEFYLKRVLKHRELDEIIQGTGWEDGKGCAVGCTLENYDHAQYEVELGIPEWLARLEDTIFEGLTEKVALDWPARFLSAINVGADLEKVKVPFIVFILEKNIEYMDSCVFDRENNPDVVKAIDGSKSAVRQMIDAHKLGEESAAESAARSAESAWSAARSARSAESAARSAAWSAESAAESAARSAESAARSAESAARSAESAAWSAAWSAAYEIYADKLIELLKENQMTPALKSAIEKIKAETHNTRVDYENSCGDEVFERCQNAGNIGMARENARLRPIIERLTLALTLAMERFNKYETLPDIPESPEANTAVLIIRTNAIADAADVLAILEGK